MSANFRDVDRNTRYLFPESIDEWVPEDHLARFVVEIVDSLDIANIERAYSGGGIAPYHPRMLLALIFYGYATGVFSSRKIEKGTYDSVPFRYITVNSHPDHDTISNFRKRFLSEIESFFTQLLLIANRAGCLKLGSVSLDGTKIHANASKHSALSYKYACELEEKLREEVEKLMKMAEEADNTPIPDGLNIPEELSRREERIAVIAAAKEEIERRALERFEEEKKEYEEKMAARAKREEETGKKARGKTPVEPVNSGPVAKDQVNLTDPDSRIMHESGGAFEQSYNAQASVDGETQIIVTSDVTQHANDKEEVVPTLESIGALPEELGKVEKILADAGYYSEGNVNACEDAKITPFIAPGRIPHNQSFLEECAEPEPEVEPVNSDPVAKTQVDLTDPDSRITHESGGAFEQSYNAQASVDGETQIIVTSDITQHANDKEEEVVPTQESIGALPEELGKAEKIPADAGCNGEANVNAYEDVEITPFIEPGQTLHNQDFLEGCAESEAEKEKSSAAVERMKQRLKTKEGRKIFSRRKCTIEPVFGIIKHVMGFRQFLLRGIKSVRGEWRLVCMSWNIKRLHKIIMNEKGLQLI
jgi:transposase